VNSRGWQPTGTDALGVTALKGPNRPGLARVRPIQGRFPQRTRTEGGHGGHPRLFTSQPSGLPEGQVHLQESEMHPSASV
jgi:hypothetical protein